MGTNSSISNFKRWPWPFIVSLVLLILLQVGLDHCPAFWRYVERNCRFHFDDALRLESVLRGIPHDAPFKKVLVLGTSRAGRGLISIPLTPILTVKISVSMTWGLLVTFIPLICLC